MDDYFEMSREELDDVNYNELQAVTVELDVAGNASKDDIIDAILEADVTMKKRVTSLTDVNTPVVDEDDTVYYLRKGESVEVDEIKNEEELGNKVRVNEVQS